jgi:hypothetical protein
MVALATLATASVTVLRQFIGFRAIFSVRYEGRLYRVAVTRESDREINPAGVFSVTIGALGGRLSVADQIRIMGKAVEVHSAWYRTAIDGGPTYTLPEVVGMREFNEAHPVRGGTR